MDHSLMEIKKLITIIVVLGLFLALLIVCQVDVLLTCVLMIWAILFVYSIVNLKDNIAVFCFLFAFFVFLLGRQVVYALFDRIEVYSFLDTTNTYTYVLLILSLISLCFGMWMASNGMKIIGISGDCKSFLDSPQFGENYSLACKLFFLFCLFFSFVAVVFQISFVRTVGYLSTYTNEFGSAGIPSFVLYFATFTPVALSLYLATFPSKKHAMQALILYEVYGVMTVFTGQRYPFIGISMFVLTYIFIRSRLEKGWVQKKHYIALLVSVPVLVIFLTAYDAIRMGDAFDFKSLGDTIVTFFDQQGGSINTIRRTIYNADELRDMHLVSLNSTYSVICENFIARSLFGIETFSGNTIERAMAGHDLSARLSLIAYGEEYLSGMGTGSSYIAELLHDFGVVGVVFGNIFYGFALVKISRIHPGNKLLNGIGLAMVYYLFLAPRGGFDAFVGSVFRIYSFIFFAVIILLAAVLRGDLIAYNWIKDKRNV